MNDFNETEIQFLEGREIASALAPTSVALLSAINNDNEASHHHCIATIAWFMPISHDPSMIAFALRGQGETAVAITKSKAFALNLLSPNYLESVLVCGNAVDNRFEKANLHAILGRTNTIAVKEAHSVFECVLIEKKNYGDHDLFIGKVEYAYRRKNKISTNILIKDRSIYGTFLPIES